VYLGFTKQRHDEHRKHEPIMGVWGRAYTGVKGLSPWSGCQRGKDLPLKLKHFWFLDVQ